MYIIVLYVHSEFGMGEKKNILKIFQFRRCYTCTIKQVPSARRDENLNVKLGGMNAG
jgi:hypothetical protein